MVGRVTNREGVGPPCVGEPTERSTADRGPRADEARGYPCRVVRAAALGEPSLAREYTGSRPIRRPEHGGSDASVQAMPSVAVPEARCIHASERLCTKCVTCQPDYCDNEINDPPVLMIEHAEAHDALAS